MEFLGLNLSLVPTAALNDWRAYIIPVLYVISSVASMKLTMNMQNRHKKEGAGKEMEAMAQANKTMMYMMPAMSVYISLIAPLGLALYWLVNSLLMIIERLVLDRFILDKEEIPPAP